MFTSSEQLQTKRQRPSKRDAGRNFVQRHVGAPQPTRIRERDVAALIPNTTSMLASGGLDCQQHHPANDTQLIKQLAKQRVQQLVQQPVKKHSTTTSTSIIHQQLYTNNYKPTTVYQQLYTNNYIPTTIDEHLCTNNYIRTTICQQLLANSYSPQAVHQQLYTSNYMPTTI